MLNKNDKVDQNSIKITENIVNNMSRLLIKNTNTVKMYKIQPDFHGFIEKSKKIFLLI